MPKDKWATDYPFAGDLAAVGGYLHTTEEHGEQPPFGYYQISRVDDGLTIGGRVQRLTPRKECRSWLRLGNIRSRTWLRHRSLRTLLTLAANHGVEPVLADTTVEDVASQRTLANAGFTLVDADADLQYYQVRLAEPLG